MLDVLKSSNIKMLFDKFVKGEDLYPTLVGLQSEAVFSEIDMIKQKNVVNLLNQQEVLKFAPGYAPTDGYNSDDFFCRAASKNFNFDNVGHRLYMNMGDDRMDFVSLFIRMCHDSGISFYVKWDKQTVRKDNIVLYIEQDKIEETVAVIDKLVSKYPDFATSKDLPITLHNGGFFGYGEETPGKGNISYNRRVSNALVNAFKDEGLFNELRHSISLNSITDFAKELYSVHLQSKVDKGESIEMVEKTSATLEMFEMHALKMCLQFFGESGSGFVKEQDENTQKLSHYEQRQLAKDQPVFEIFNKSLGKKSTITSSMVLETIFKLMQQNKAKLITTSEEHDAMLNSFSNNLREELTQDNITFTQMPSCLNGLAKKTYIKPQHTSDFSM